MYSKHSTNYCKYITSMISKCQVRTHNQIITTCWWDFKLLAVFNLHKSLEDRLGDIICSSCSFSLQEYFGNAALLSPQKHYPLRKTNFIMEIYWSKHLESPERSAIETWIMVQLVQTTVPPPHPFIKKNNCFSQDWFLPFYILNDTQHSMHKGRMEHNTGISVHYS